MKARLLPFGLLAAVMVAAPGGASALLPDVSVEGTLASRYVWRGTVATDDPVFQPGAAVSFAGFGARLWGNLDLGDSNGKSGEFSEIDYTLFKSLGAGPLGLRGGFVYYDYPGRKSLSTLELFLSARAEVLLGVWGSAAIHKDVDEADGAHYGLGFGYRWPVGPPAEGLDLAVRWGYGSRNHNLFYYGVDAASASDLALEIGLPMRLGGLLTVTPGLSYWTLLGKVADASRDDSHLVFGLKLAAGL